MIINKSGDTSRANPVFYAMVKPYEWRHMSIKSQAPRLFVQLLIHTNKKEHMKAPHRWPFMRRMYRFHSQRASDSEKFSMS